MYIVNIVNSVNIINTKNRLNKYYCVIYIYTERRAPDKIMILTGSNERRFWTKFIQIFS